MAKALPVLAAVTVMAAPAAAQPITYSYVTSVTGTLGGDALVGEVRFTGVADTAVTTAYDGFPALNLSSLTLTTAGITYRVTTPMLLFANDEYGIAGFVKRGTYGNAFSFGSSDLVDFRGGTAVTAATTANYTRATLTTDGGRLRLTGQGAGTFSAVLGVPPAVPEPASWALLLAGFGLVGAAVRASGRPGVRFGA